MSGTSSALGSIPGMECLRSITSLVHLPLPKRAIALSSAQDRVRKLHKEDFVAWDRGEIVDIVLDAVNMESKVNAIRMRRARVETESEIRMIDSLHNLPRCFPSIHMGT